MPESGKFDYVAIVPEHADASFECTARLRETQECTGDELQDARLVGFAPLVRVSDAGLTPDAGPRRPWVMRSEIRLSAPAGDHAAVADASFHVDRALTSCMKAGDELHLTRTEAGGIALSVIRGGELVVAVGALTAVPLGTDITATIPTAMVDHAERVFREADPEFEFPECPLDIRVRGARSILYGGSREFGAYEVDVVHGPFVGEPGTDECAAIWRKGWCSDAAARASARLLEGLGRESTR